jgi:hypothetical protein
LTISWLRLPAQTFKKLYSKREILLMNFKRNLWKPVAGREIPKVKKKADKPQTGSKIMNHMGWS